MASRLSTTYVLVCMSPFLSAMDMINMRKTCTVLHKYFTPKRIYGQFKQHFLQAIHPKIASIAYDSDIAFGGWMLYDILHGTKRKKYFNPPYEWNDVRKWDRWKLKIFVVAAEFTQKLQEVLVSQHWHDYIDFATGNCEESGGASKNFAVFHGTMEEHINRVQKCIVVGQETPTMKMITYSEAYAKLVNLSSLHNQNCFHCRFSAVNSFPSEDELAVGYDFWAKDDFPTVDLSYRQFLPCKYLYNAQPAQAQSLQQPQPQPQSHQLSFTPSPCYTARKAHDLPRCFSVLQQTKLSFSMLDGLEIDPARNDRLFLPFASFDVLMEEFHSQPTKFFDTYIKPMKQSRAGKTLSEHVVVWEYYRDKFLLMKMHREEETVLQRRKEQSTQASLAWHRVITNLYKCKMAKRMRSKEV